MNEDLLTLANDVVADPQAVNARGAGEGFAALVPRLLVLSVVASALFGAAVGCTQVLTHGWPALWVALKMPLTLLAPVLLGAPVVRALFGATGMRLSRRQVALASLVGQTRSALVLAALAPAVALGNLAFHSVGVAALSETVALGVAALVGGWAVIRALHIRRLLPLLAIPVCAGVVVAISGATGYALRPFIAPAWPGTMPLVLPAMLDTVAAMLAAWTLAGGFVAVALSQRGLPLATSAAAIPCWPLLIGLLRDDATPDSGGPFAARIEAAFGPLMHDPTLREAFGPLRASLERADGRLAGIQAVLNQPSKRSPEVQARLEEAWGSAEASLEEALAEVLQLRIQASLQAFADEARPVRAHLAELKARTAALDELSDAPF
ncbi:MAG: hypothetical protein H6739_03165 [Alphaproteobacteria bacterium]|nr:hypothetical protein [Alphaproteobacteria bacterium]